MGNESSSALQGEERRRYAAEEELRVTREREAARLRAEEEKRIDERELLEDLRLKRTKLLSNFNSQKYLMIGAPGAGKSSFINSFNYVVNLIFDENADYEEVADVGGGKGRSTTEMFEEFSAEIDEGVFSKMTNEEMRTKAPAFFDVAGIPNRSKYGKLIQAMAQGKVEDETAINPLLHKVDEAPEDLEAELAASSEKLMSWGIMFVVSLTDVSNVPDALAKGLADAVRELKHLQCG